jgi:integrase
LSLSDAAIRKCKPGLKPFKLSDGGGLFLLVQPSGSKWWRYKYRFAGKEKLLALGLYPDISLADARKRHSQARKLLAEGKDPSRVKQQAKRAATIDGRNTFETIAREWHSKRSPQWSVSHADKILKRFEADLFRELGSVSIKEIGALELLDAVKKVENRGAVDTAHRLLQNCTQIFSYAVITKRLDRNPVTDLRGALTTVQKSNNAYLKADELPEFLTKLDRYEGHPQTKLALRFLLLTFVRTGELRGAEWKEINFEKAEWRIPAERMKMREGHIVPLATQAVAVLEELKKITGQWNFVFPNQHKPSGCMSENTILYALYRMGYHSRATGHGFRSTASTILNENGFIPDVIERQLAHCERNQVRAAYNHAQYLPHRREMMQWWADYLDKAEALNR